MMMKTLLLGITAAVGLTSCAQDLTHPPVYRGEYYAFDVYPYGYKDYPGFPYYGVPFGYGGAAFAATEEHVTQDTTKEVRTIRRSSRARHARSSRADNRGAPDSSR